MTYPCLALDHDDTVVKSTGKLVFAWFWEL